MARAATWPVLFALALPIFARADDIRIPPPPAADAVAQAPSFGPDDRIVATHYFYWYKWPDEHFFSDAPKTRTDQRHHFPDHRRVSYESAAWHRRQMDDMAAAGIDVALCIYWGTPNNYDKPELRFSVRGLPPLIQALDDMAAATPAVRKSTQPHVRSEPGAAATGLLATDSKRGETRPPKLALFFDTSTLLAGHAFREPGRGNVDLRTDEGKDIFYRTIRDFFCLVPPRHWACIHGRPVVQLYESAFAAGHDQSTIDYVYRHFEQDFAGRRPFVIAGPSWSFAADESTGWGAALNGPLFDKTAVQIGPGYDDSPVLGRNTPTRDRLGGAFYAASWLLAIQHRPRLVIVETWSELHEGTPVCETLEDGRRYIELTRHFSGIYKSGDMPAAEDWAAALRAMLNAPQSSRDGRKFAGELWMNCHPGAGTTSQLGMRLVKDVSDGLFTIPADASEIRTVPGANSTRYLYFDIADPYYYQHSGDLTLRFAYFDEGHAPIVVEYDSAAAPEPATARPSESEAAAKAMQAQPAAAATGTRSDRQLRSLLTLDPGPLRQRYRPCPPIQRTESRTWKTATVVLENARCANHQNGGADFRLASPGADLAIRRVEVTKLPPDYRDAR